jgi:hypothetical protein
MTDKGAQSAFPALQDTHRPSTSSAARWGAERLSGPPGLAQALHVHYMGCMTIVTYVRRRKKPPRKPKAAPASALAAPAVVTRIKRRGPKLPIEREDDPEAKARLVEFFKGMGMTYVPHEG